LFFFFGRKPKTPHGLLLAKPVLHHLSLSTSPFLWWYFQDRVLWTICLALASNHHPPDLCLLSSWDYRHEPLAPSSTNFSIKSQIGFVGLINFCHIFFFSFSFSFVWEWMLFVCKMFLQPFKNIKPFSSD
jgi:hypothetical protein